MEQRSTAFCQDFKATCIYFHTFSSPFFLGTLVQEPYRLPPPPPPLITHICTRMYFWKRLDTREDIRGERGAGGTGSLFMLRRTKYSCMNPRTREHASCSYALVFFMKSVDPWEAWTVVSFFTWFFYSVCTKCSDGFGSNWAVFIDGIYMKWNTLTRDTYKQTHTLWVRLRKSL